jgi:hypothetical protein
VESATTWMTLCQRLTTLCLEKALACFCDTIRFDRPHIKRGSKRESCLLFIVEIIGVGRYSKSTPLDAFETRA